MRRFLEWKSANGSAINSNRAGVLNNGPAKKKDYSTLFNDLYTHMKNDTIYGVNSVISHKATWHRLEIDIAYGNNRETLTIDYDMLDETFEVSLKDRLTGQIIPIGNPPVASHLYDNWLKVLKALAADKYVKIDFANNYELTENLVEWKLADGSSVSSSPNTTISSANNTGYKKDFEALADYYKKGNWGCKVNHLTDEILELEFNYGSHKEELKIYYHDLSNDFSMYLVDKNKVRENEVINRSPLYTWKGVLKVLERHGYLSNTWINNYLSETLKEWKLANGSSVGTKNTSATQSKIPKDFTKQFNELLHHLVTVFSGSYAIERNPQLASFVIQVDKDKIHLLTIYYNPLSGLFTVLLQDATDEDNLQKIAEMTLPGEWREVIEYLFVKGYVKDDKLAEEYSFAKEFKEYENLWEWHKKEPEERYVWKIILNNETYAQSAEKDVLTQKWSGNFFETEDDAFMTAGIYLDEWDDQGDLEEDRDCYEIETFKVTTDRILEY